MKIVVKLILSLIIAIAASLVSGRFASGDRFESIVVGLLIFIISILILEVVNISRNLDRLRNQYEAVLRCLQGFLDGEGGFGDFFNLTVLEQLRTMAASDEILIPREKLFAFWLKMIAHCEHRFYATSYVDPKTWDLAYIGLGLALQASRRKQGVDIRRVFILQTSDEMDAVRKFIEDQRKVGIDARYIMKEDIANHPAIAKCSLDSLDFIIIDEGFLAVEILDRKRDVVRMRLTSNQEDLEKYKLFYEQLFNEARTP